MELSGVITGVLLPVLVISLKACVSAPGVLPASLGDTLLMLHWGSVQYVCVWEDKWYACVHTNSRICLCSPLFCSKSLQHCICTEQSLWTCMMFLHSLFIPHHTWCLHICGLERSVNTASFGLHPGSYWCSQIDALHCWPSRRCHQLNWWGLSDPTTQVGSLIPLPKIW